MSKPVTKSKSRKSTKPYHHGDLRAALLEAAREIVAESGVEGLTLRACARRAGVSHGAPTHHFGSLASLLAEFAADGYERLAAAMEFAAADTAHDPLRAAGIGYIRFAMTHPAHFRVMRRRELLDEESARLQKAGDAVKRLLRDALREAYTRFHGYPPAEDLLAARSALAWCCVHGYASLWVEGALRTPGSPNADLVLSQLRPALVAP